MHYVFVDGTKVSLSTCRRYLSRKYLFFVHLLFIRTRHHGNQCFKVNTSAVLAEIACQVVSNFVGNNRKLALVSSSFRRGISTFTKVTPASRSFSNAAFVTARVSSSWFAMNSGTMPNRMPFKSTGWIAEPPAIIWSRNARSDTTSTIVSAGFRDRE